nr:hypothetical protein CFP56_33476 [Quercus suber]
MNFDPMPVVNENSDLMFWWIAGPLMGAVVIVTGTRAIWARTAVWMRRRRLVRQRQITQPAMNKPTTLLLFGTLAWGTVINYQMPCMDKNSGVINAIGMYCQNDDMVVPSDYANKGQQGYDGDNWAFLQITGNCQPPQWVPSKYCISQFQEICATGDEHGAGSKTFGRDGCQTWTISNGERESEGADEIGQMFNGLFI